MQSELRELFQKEEKRLNAFKHIPVCRNLTPRMTDSRVTATPRSRFISPLQLEHPATSNDQLKTELVSMSEHLTIEATRLYKARNIFGFRKYNKLHAIATDALLVYHNIVMLMRGRQEALNLAIQQIDDALDGLRLAEFDFFKQCDQIVQFERKTRELDFLKTNMEAYVRNSIQIVDSEIPKLEACLVNQTHKELDLQWLNHNQYCALANNLKESLRSPGNMRPGMFSIDLARSPVVSRVMETTMQLCLEYMEKPHLKRLLDAADDFVVMRDFYFNQLVPIELWLNRAAQEQLAILGSLLVIALDAKTTRDALANRAREIAEINLKNQERDIIEEERVLREFVGNCREYELLMGEKSSAQHKTSGEHTAAGEGTKSESFLPPITPEILAGPRPVWAQVWTGAPTKILKRGRHA